MGSRVTAILSESFLDGLTGAGLFGRLRRPGAPTEFVDSRSLEEIYTSGEILANAGRFRGPKFGQHCSKLIVKGLHGCTSTSGHEVVRG
jgi:hypothetical protein